MAYIDSTLLPDERIFFRTKKSLVIFFFPGLLLGAGVAFWLMFMFVVGVLPPLKNLSNQFNIGSYLLAIIVVISLFSAFKVWLEYKTGDFVVTNRRIIMKEGFFVRHMAETRLSAISHVSVEQTLIGRIFNYGTVFVNSFGGSSDHFTQIASPVEFQKQVHIQLDALNIKPRSGS